MVNKMRADKFKIEYPDEKEIASQIEMIVDKGVTKRKSFFAYLKGMYKQIGLRYIFHDFTELIFTVVVFANVIFMVCMDGRYGIVSMNDNIYVFVFVISPLLYFAMSLIAFADSKYNVTYEVEMSCKYSIYQLAAFRMLMFSICCTAISIGADAAIVTIFKGVSLFYLITLSVTSLFIFSTVFLYVLRRTHSRYAKYLAGAGWLLFNLVPFVLCNGLYGTFIKSVPLYAYLIMAAACVVIYMENLKKLTIPKEMEM
jgi:hypothetical protein